MQSPSGFLAVGHGSFGIGQSHLSPALEGAALFMLVLMVCLLSCVFACVLVLARRARRGETPEQALLRELAEESDAGSAAIPQQAPPAWERDSDWWKK
jgi:hypothetical protein